MNDRWLLRLGSDPVRLEVLTLLNDRTASGGEIAAKLEVPVDVVARHLDQMLDSGLIEIVGKVSQEDAQPRYRAVARTLWDDKEWAALSFGERQRLTAWIIQLINSDVREAVEQGTFTVRKDSHVSRSVSMLDEQGWRELTQIQEGALEAVLAVQAASAERLAESGEAGFPALSAMLCCELPLRESSDG